MAMKKFISILLTVLLLVSASALPVFASDALLRLRLETADCKPGDTVSVSVYANANAGFTYLKLGLKFDETALKLDTVKNGALIESLTEGRYYVWSADKNVSQEGVLVTFTFTVSDAASAGTYAVEIVCYECSDEDEQDVPVQIQDGVIAVTDKSSSLLGDVNFDGEVTARDYMIVKRYVLGTYSMDEEELRAADVNGDGDVNARDYMIIKRHVLGTYTIG